MQATPEKETPVSETYPPTPEQQAAEALYLTGRSFIVQAGAGAGKTSTLVRLANATPAKRIQYVAFNRAIVEEGKAKFPSNVRCNTAHSLAFRATNAGQRFGDRLRSSARISSLDVANFLRIDAVTLDETPAGRKHLGRPYLAGLALRGITRFCQSADTEIAARHVPYINGIDEPGEYRNNRRVAEALVPAMRRAWADLTAERGTLRFSHDVYLKLAHLEGARIGADVILFDEAQDASPVLIAIVEAQTHAQVVWVGDSQQQIYEFTGAVNALERVRVDGETFLTQSFRFGPEIAHFANVILSWIPDARLRLVGSGGPGAVEALDDPDAVLTRTNATAVRELLAALADGKRPHLVGGGADLVAFCEAAQRLMDGERVSHPELACFDSWGEVRRYVEEDEQGKDLELLVKLLDEFGVDTILDALRNMPDERDADLVISTAHKSKGRQWGRVRIAGDFPEDRGKLGDSEARLLYVAVTRAQVVLDVTQVTILDGAESVSPAEAAPEPTRTLAGPEKPAEIPTEAATQEPGIREGRYEVAGRVTNLVTRDGKFGPYESATVLLADGSALQGPATKALRGVKVGDTVRFVADVTPNGKPGFGFFRNTQAAPGGAA